MGMLLLLLDLGHATFRHSKVSFSKTTAHQLTMTTLYIKSKKILWADLKNSYPMQCLSDLLRVRYKINRFLVCLFCRFKFPNTSLEFSCIRKSPKSDCTRLPAGILFRIYFLSHRPYSGNPGIHRTRQKKLG